MTDEAFARFVSEQLASVAHVPACAPRDVWPLDGRTWLVDVREPEERAVSMLPGAVTEAWLQANPVPPDHVLVPYCTVGLRSGRVARAWLAAGRPARNLWGGVLAWARAGLPFAHDGQGTWSVHVYGPTWDVLPPPYRGVHPGAP